MTFSSTTRWTDYDEKTPIGMYSGGGFVNTTDPTQPGYDRTLQQFDSSSAEHVDSFATDSRLAATVATGALTYKLLAGVDYRNVRNRATYGFVPGGTLDAFAPVYIRRVRFRRTTRRSTISSG